MINAANTASGRFLNSGVSTSTVIRISTAAINGEISERAPAPSFTADCERLPPPARPPSNPDPALATPRAISSWLGSIS